MKFIYKNQYITQLCGLCVIKEETIAILRIASRVLPFTSCYNLALSRHFDAPYKNSQQKRCHASFAKHFD